MVELAKIREQRFIFMKRLYELSEADSTAFIPESEIIEGTDIDKSKAQAISQYLSKKGLLKYAANGPTFNITAYGIDEIETALSNPQKDTPYFGPVVNILNINSVEGSQIQQGTTNSSQTMTIQNYDTSKLSEIVEIFMEKLDDLELDLENSKTYLADVKTIEAQIESSKPKNDIIKSCLLSLKSILENVAGSIVATELLRMIAGFVG